MASEPKWKSLDQPAVNSRWDRKGSIYASAPGARNYNTARVMAVVEGYVMARFSGCIPFLVHMSDWHGRFQPKQVNKKVSRHD